MWLTLWRSTCLSVQVADRGQVQDELCFALTCRHPRREKHNDDLKILIRLMIASSLEEPRACCHAVREWCINTAAVNPATKSVFTPSEDGRTYRWNLATNSLTEWVQLGAGIGEPYVPTVIGPDGTVFALHGGFLWALGNVNGVRVAVTSSTPDVRTVVTGQSLTFTASLTNPGTSGLIPTWTVTFTDTTYAVVSGNLQTTTTTLASNMLLNSNGNATYSSSTLPADSRFITVQYSGDSNFSAGSSSLVQGFLCSFASNANPYATALSKLSLTTMSVGLNLTPWPAMVFALRSPSRATILRKLSRLFGPQPRTNWVRFSRFLCIPCTWAARRT